MQRAHTWTAVCSGHNILQETGMVHEALRGVVVPVHRWVSTCDGSRELSRGPFVWMVYVISLFYGFLTTSYIMICNVKMLYFIYMI